MSLLWPVSLHLLSPSGEVMEECEHDWESFTEVYSTGELFDYQACANCGEERENA